MYIVHRTLDAVMSEVVFLALISLQKNSCHRINFWDLISNLIYFLKLPKNNDFHTLLFTVQFFF